MEAVVGASRAAPNVMVDRAEPPRHGGVVCDGESCAVRPNIPVEP